MAKINVNSTEITVVQEVLYQRIKTEKRRGLYGFVKEKLKSFGKSVSFQY